MLNLHSCHFDVSLSSTYLKRQRGYFIPISDQTNKTKHLKKIKELKLQGWRTGRKLTHRITGRAVVVFHPLSTNNAEGF